MGSNCCSDPPPPPIIQPKTCTSELPFSSLYQRKLAMLEDKFLLEAEFNKTKDKELSLFCFQQKLVCNNFIEHLQNAKEETNEYIEKAKEYLEIENMNDEERKKYFAMMGLDEKEAEKEWQEMGNKRLMKTKEF